MTNDEILLVGLVVFGIFLIGAYVYFRIKFEISF